MSLVITECPVTGVDRIAINRPGKRNAINPDTRKELIDVLTNSLSDDAVKAIVMGSTEGHFCAGGDINSMVELDARSARKRMKENHQLVRVFAEAEKPIIAAVEGFAVGAGAGIALLCDTIVLSEEGSLGFPFFRVGLTPDYGILFTLARRVGLAKARQILLFSKNLKGHDALKVGLADIVVEKGTAEEYACACAEELVKMPRHAFALTKRHLAMEPQTLEEALEMEALSQSLAFLGPEFEEGRLAFQEKRKPKFR